MILIMFLLGVLVGVALMCILQINRLNKVEQFSKSDLRALKYYTVFYHGDERVITVIQHKGLKRLEGKKVDLLLKLIN